MTTLWRGVAQLRDPSDRSLPHLQPTNAPSRARPRSPVLSPPGNPTPTFIEKTSLGFLVCTASASGSLR